MSLGYDFMQHAWTQSAGVFRNRQVATCSEEGRVGWKHLAASFAACGEDTLFVCSDPTLPTL